MSEPDVDDRPGHRGKMRRRRKRLRINSEDPPHVNIQLPQQEENVIDTNSDNKFGFLTFISLAAVLQVNIILHGSIGPGDRWGVIGEGGSFIVYKNLLPYVHKDQDTDKLWDSGSEVVLKRSRVGAGTKGTGLSQIESRYKSVSAELLVLRHPPIKEHENILDLLGITWDFEDWDKSIWPVLILEYSELGSMDAFDFMSLEYKIQALVDIAKALICLHNCGVAHCDVKSENVLLFPGPDDNRPLIAKLCDFGCAILDINSETSHPEGIPHTKPWNAPEYNKHLTGLDIMKTDVYSFGMMIWRVVMDNDPFRYIDLPTDPFERALHLEELKWLNRILKHACSAVEKYCTGEDFGSLIRTLECTLESNAQLRDDMPKIIAILDKQEIDESEYFPILNNA
jgi:serine/threonine protein kinase